MKFFFTLVFCCVSVWSMQAQTYYWVGGTGSWNQLSHWASCSGCPGNAFVQVPQSFNDVVFDNNSGIVAGSTITLSTGTSSNVTCKSITFNTGGAAPTIIGSSQFDIYGSLTLQTGMNVSGWSGDIAFLSTGNEVHQFRSLSMMNTNISFEPTGGNHIVHNYRQGNARYLLLRQGTGRTVDFQSSFAGSFVNVYSGTTNVNTPMLGTFTGGRVRTLTVSGGTININQNSSIAAMQISGTASSNAVVNMIGNTHDLLDFSYSNTAIGTFNISNATINITTWDVRNASINLTTTGSVLNFNIGTVGSFQGANEVYNEVNFQIFTNLRAFNSFPNATFNTLRFFKGTRVLDANVSYTVNNLLRLESGGMYNASGDRDEFDPPYLSFVPQSACITQLVGTCASKLFLRRMRFNFATGAQLGLQADHVKMDDVIATGSFAPNYQAGANSYAVPNTGVSGWVAGAAAIGQPAARQLRWVVGGSSSRWSDFNNWQDIPSGVIGQCPPTMSDYVEFPNGSVVVADSAAIECHDMRWLGSGSFSNGSYTYNNALLEVYGSLEWSSAMTLNYNGVIKLRSWDLAPTIRSNGKLFPFKLVIETTNVNTNYSLLDILQVPFNFAQEYSLILYKGGLISNNQSISVNNFTTYRTNNIRRLNLGNSDFYVRSRYLSGNSTFLYGFEANSVSNNLTINAGNSHIHILDSLDGALTRMVLGAGHRLNKITFYGPTPVFDRSSYQGHSYVNELTFIQGGFYTSTLNSTDTIHLFRTNTQNIVNGFTLTENNGTANATINLMVDSAQYYGNTVFNRNVAYRQLMFLNPGSSYTINHATLFTQQLLAPNGRLSAVGTCINNIKITGGNFTSTQAQSGSYLILTNNTASGATFSYSNSIINGTVTGWTGAPNAARTLYWYDGVAGNSRGLWNQNQNWSLANGVMLDALGGNNPGIGNCPPTRIDTVIFSNGSFNGAADTVEISLDPNSAECADMRWIHNNSIAPVFKAGITEQLDLYGSLIFSRTMRQNMMGHVYFLGNPTVRTITSNGQQFNLKTIFDAPGATWILQDSFRAPAFVSNATSPNTYPHTVDLRQGTLNTNNQTVIVESFGSTSTSTRNLTLGSSQFIVTGTYVNGGGSVRYPYQVQNAGFSVNAGTSIIRFTNIYSGNNNLVPYSRMLAGDNTIYYDIEGTSNVGFLGIFSNNVRARNVNFFGGGYIGTTNGIFNKVNGNSTVLIRPLVIAGAANTMDSLVNAGHGEFRSSNRYNKLLRLSPAKNYTFASDSTQYLANAAELYAIGTGGGGEIFFNATNTNRQGYIQKDSGIICIDFIYLRDIWAIGNGLSTQSACATRFCDTMQLSSNLPTRASSGRALFQAGANANDQGNNKGWDFTPYPPVPSFIAPPSTQQFCPGDTFQALYSLTGQLPINVSFDYTVNGVTIQVDSFNITPISGNGTTASPYIWGVNTILNNSTINVSVEARSINSDRCFNNTALGSGLLSADIQSCLLLSSRFIRTQAVCAQNQVSVFWEQVVSPNTLRFVVERSPDGILFENIATVIYQPNQTKYQYVDAQALSGQNYYRIKAVEANGNSYYSAVFNADCKDGAGSPSVVVFPNPSPSNAISFQIVGTVNGPLEVALYDALGRMVYQNNFAANHGMIQPDLPLNSGVYFLIVQQSNWRKMVKVVIED